MATVALSLIALHTGAAPSVAADEGGAASTAAFSDRLTASDLMKWHALTSAQRRAAQRILADPRVQRGFSSLGEAKLVSSAIGLVETRNTASAPVRATLAAAATSATATTYEVHSWYARTWTIFGIAYTSTRLDYHYVTGSGVVLYDHYCSASYVNRVPMRSMSVQVNHYVSGGKGTCVATWTLTKLNFWTDTRDQGMRVNGRGVEATWGP